MKDKSLEESLLEFLKRFSNGIEEGFMWREARLLYITVEQGGRKRGSRNVRSQPVLEMVKFPL